MKKCSTCDRALKVYRLRCEVCGSFNWYKPQIAIAASLAFLAIGAGLLLLDQFATTETTGSAPKQNQSPQQSSSAPPRPQNIHGTRNGVAY